jgi:hypothetical protein
VLGSRAFVHMKHPVEQVGWLVVGLLLGGLIAYSTNALAADPIVSEQTVTTNGTQTTTVKSPPPSAIAPQFSAGNGNDLCTVGASGAVQTQILGISVGSTFTEENCIRLKNAKTLYDMGMKVAAVSVMCQDQKVFDAMMMAGTPCPYDGKIGEEAKLAWKTHTDKTPEEENLDDVEQKRLKALGIIGGVFGSLLFF